MARRQMRAQHVGAAFVARDDAVGDGERAGADVVSDHLEGRGFRIDGFAARLLKDALDAGEQVLEEVDVVVVVHALENGGQCAQDPCPCRRRASEACA